MTEFTVAGLKISPEAQQAFAKLSGDHNPMHVDPLYARRTLARRPVVHGMHLLFCSLESIAARQRIPPLLRVTAEFKESIGICESFELNISGPNEHKIAKITGEGHTLAIFHFEPACGDFAVGEVRDLSVFNAACRERLPSEIAGSSGALGFALNREMLECMFPHVAQTVPLRQSAILLLLTRLVGMECPGLHSVFMGFDLDFAGDVEGEDVLSYQVRRFDPRFSLVEMDIKAPACRGQVKAFLRPPPAKQVEYEYVKSQIQPHEFKGQRALVVGGSRGLGEVAAKLLAAGGASVTVTYHRGRADAERVCGEIIEGGGVAEVRHLDVMDSQEGCQLMRQSGTAFNSLYYFATPAIFSGRRSSFSSDRFADFCRFYVEGFALLVGRLMESTKKLDVFYPSSVAVEVPPANMGEYAAAKSAGESLCRFLQGIHVGLTCYYPRLPRLETDQTASIIASLNRPPFDTMLAELRAMIAKKQ